MAQEDTKKPVMLRFVSSTRTASPTGKRRERMVLDVDIEDEHVWADARRRLEAGLILHATKTLQESVLHATLSENQQQTDQIAALKKQLEEERTKYRRLEFDYRQLCGRVSNET